MTSVTSSSTSFSRKIFGLLFQNLTWASCTRRVGLGRGMTALHVSPEKLVSLPAIDSITEPRSSVLLLKVGPFARGGVEAQSWSEWPTSRPRGVVLATALLRCSNADLSS